MAAFTYRMGGGFPGAVNRIHAAMIEPVLIDPAAPPTGYGQAVIVDITSTNGVRQPNTGDGSAVVYGCTVRPFPTQQQSGGMSAALGAATPPVTGVIDVLKSGYMTVAVSGTVNPVKGTPLYMWYAASAGQHVQGGFETSNTGGSTLLVGALPGFYWNGPADSNGYAEIAFNV